MKRAVSVLAVLVLLVMPVALVEPRSAEAAVTMTIVTQERGSGKRILGACYNVADVSGVPFGVTEGCDSEDGALDGTTKIQAATAPCDSCRVSLHSLPRNADGSATYYLPEPDQTGGFSDTYTFVNFFKPLFVVTARDAETGKLVKGACITMYDIKQGGTDFGGCDGGPKTATGGDQDGRKNGKIVTTRLPNTGKFRVYNPSPFPSGYRAAKPVEVRAVPLKAGKSDRQ